MSTVSEMNHVREIEMRSDGNFFIIGKGALSIVQNFFVEIFISALKKNTECTGPNLFFQP